MVYFALKFKNSKDGVIVYKKMDYIILELQILLLWYTEKLLMKQLMN